MASHVQGDVDASEPVKMSAMISLALLKKQKEDDSEGASAIIREAIKLNPNHPWYHPSPQTSAA